MKYLIDGHNLIARLPDVSLTDPNDEAKLIRLLARWRWRHNSPAVTVVFDSGDYPVYGKRQTRQSGLTVRYAPHSTNADTVLVRLIERSPKPAQLTVVSSDHEIQAAARRSGAHVTSAEDFTDELAAPPEPEEKLTKEEPLSPEEVEAWLKLFKGDGGRR